MLFSSWRIFVLDVSFPILRSQRKVHVKHKALNRAVIRTLSRARAVYNTLRTVTVLRFLLEGWFPGSLTSMWVYMNQHTVAEI